MHPIGFLIRVVAGAAVVAVVVDQLGAHPLALLVIAVLFTVVWTPPRSKGVV